MPSEAAALPPPPFEGRGWEQFECRRTNASSRSYSLSPWLWPERSARMPKGMPKAVRRPMRRRSRASPRTPSTIPTARSARSPRVEVRSRSRSSQALQDGRLAFSGDKVFIRDKSGTVLDAATGKPAASPPGDLKTVRLNNRLRRSVEAALGGLTLLAADPAKRYEAAQAVFKSRDANALPTLDAALAKETDSRVKRALAEARAAVILFQADAKENDKLAAVTVIRERGDQDARGLLAGLPSRPVATGASRRHRRDRVDRQPARAVERGAECLVRALARLGAAARRHRPRHHVRRDGRHQHGAWRDGDARRLHDLHGAGDHPHALSRPVRRLAVHRGAARVFRCRLRRHRDRALRHPVPLRPPARNAARDLGPVADPAAGGAHRVRADQQGSRQSVLDERRLRTRRHHHHL